MGRGRSRRSRVIGLLLALQALLAASGAVYIAVDLGLEWQESQETTEPLRSLLLLLGFLPLLIVTLHRRSELVSGQAADRLRALHLLASLFSIAAAIVLSGEITPQWSWLVWTLFLPPPLIIAAMQWSQRRKS